MEKKIKEVKLRLKEMPEVLAVYLFGSHVYGLEHKFSDLDIGVVLTEPEKVLSSPKKSLKLYEKFFDVFAPLVYNSNKLDLVFLQKAPLSLQKEVLLSGELIYCKDPQLLLDYKEKTLLKYADIKPVYEQFFREVYNTRL